MPWLKPNDGFAFALLTAGLLSIVGAVMLIAKVAALLVPVLPAESLWLACAVYVPAARLLAGVADHVPADAVALRVWATEPPVPVPL